MSVSADAHGGKTTSDTLNADRPDQTESPHIVAKGRLQIEAGFTVNPFDSSAGKTPLVGIMVLRYGMSKKLELRVMAEDGRDRDRFLTETTQGVYPLAIGGKLLLLERERGIVPQMALLSWLKVPITSRTSEQSAYWSPQVLLAFENKLNDKLELEYNAGVKQEPYDTDWEAMSSGSLHVELNKRISLFAEYFGSYQPHEDPMHNVDGGLMYLMNAALQIDFAFGRTISAAEEKHNTFGSIGLSLRIPD